MSEETGQDPEQLHPLEVIQEIRPYLSPLITFIAKASASDFEIRFKVQFGSGGPTEYFFRLCDLINEEVEAFAPTGYAEWQETSSQENIQIADQRVKELTGLVQGYIFDRLKHEYGTENDAYWEIGVTSKEMKIKAFTKSQDYSAEERLDLEAYLDFFDLRKIVENKQNWPLFKNVLADIPQMTSKFVEIVPLVHRQGNSILPQPSDGPILEIGSRPEGHLTRYSTIQTHLSRLFHLAVDIPRPTPERVFAVDHRSGSGFSGTVPSIRPPRPIGT